MRTLFRRDYHQALGRIILLIFAQTTTILHVKQQIISLSNSHYNIVFNKQRITKSTLSIVATLICRGNPLMTAVAGCDNLQHK